VLRPAAYDGVVGFKPTIGWTPTNGTQPVAPTIDTIGVMAAG
jgi:Asp-tRNA(Asn)/Glu-tRNA(Gln) amidotransferase A subunit family amidase